MDILDHIEKTIEIFRKYCIDKCLSRGKAHITYVAEKLRISPVQAVLFSHFMERNNDDNIELNKIADSIKCGKIRISA